MKLLLDTHALLWWLADDEQLGARARGPIEEPGNDVLVGVVSLREIVVEVRVGKLEAGIEEVAAAVQRDGFALLDIGVAHFRRATDLPMHHRDPFDHLLIAQAAVEGATSVSEDRHTPKYPVRFITCSDAV